MDKEARWGARFMAVCDLIADWSEDRDRQVGAVIVDAAHVIRATGYNGLPRGVAETPEDRFDRASGEKFHWIEHAERNAIFNAARTGTALAGCTLYTNVFPCADCARAIIQAGIVTVCTPPPPGFDSKLGRSFDASREMLAEAGVAVREVASHRAGVEI